jgi:hypothetical protein
MDGVVDGTGADDPAVMGRIELYFRRVENQFADIM